jgi:predicted NBD/HSP70 family sugar kinase
MRIRGSLADGVASAVRILVLTADVETVVIGGGLSHLGEELMVEVRAVLTTWAESSLFLASLDLPSRMRVTPENTPAAAIGAALIGAV